MKNMELYDIIMSRLPSEGFQRLNQSESEGKRIWTSEQGYKIPDGHYRIEGNPDTEYSSVIVSGQGIPACIIINHIRPAGDHIAFRWRSIIEYKKDQRNSCFRDEQGKYYYPSGIQSEDFQVELGFDGSHHHKLAFWEAEENIWLDIVSRLTYELNKKVINKESGSTK